MPLRCSILILVRIRSHAFDPGLDHHRKIDLSVVRAGESFADSVAERADALQDRCDGASEARRGPELRCKIGSTFSSACSQAALSNTGRPALMPPAEASRRHFRPARPVLGSSRAVAGR